MWGKPKTILITGAAGFIGFHLARYLHARGDTVFGVDNFNNYYSIDLKRRRAKELSPLGIPITEGDICDLPLLDNLVKQNKITHIAHLAAQAGVRHSLVNPQAYIETNITGFLNMLELCRKHPAIKLTYASSSSVYGTNTKIPFSTDDPTDHPASLYGATKKSNEVMAYAYHHLFGISVTGLRFFTVYGPWGRPDMAYYIFAKAIMEGKAITVYNYGKMQRDFTYIDDIVEGTAAAIDRGDACELYNLGSSNPEPLSALIKALEEKIGKKAILEHLPMQAGDVEMTYADMRRTQRMLGFTATIPLKEGISHFVDWLMQI